MAATIARAIGRSQRSDGTKVETEGTRLGHQESEAQANTYRTFTTAVVRKDGSGFIRVEREFEDGKRRPLGQMTFRAEDGPADTMLVVETWEKPSS